MYIYIYLSLYIYIYIFICPSISLSLSLSLYIYIYIYITYIEQDACKHIDFKMFRKASLLLIITWFPFPIWFAISPEGLGYIDNILIIQMGWAFLNILAKFTFIFYIQRVKDNYCSRLKVKRELIGVMPGVDPSVEAH